MGFICQRTKYCNFSTLTCLNPNIDDINIKKYGTGTVTEPVQKSHKIKGFEQSINSINLKNKYY